MEPEAMGQVLSPLRKSQRTVIALVVEAIATLGQASSLAIAVRLAQNTGAGVPSALVRFYRLLHNRRVDDLRLSRQMIRTLARRTETLLVSIDWTEWHPPLRMLLASVVAGTRAVPVLTATFIKTAMVRSQNCWENTFLKMLVMVLEEARVVACFLADRGFRRASFIKLLLEYPQHTFLVRLQAKVSVGQDGEKRLLRNIGLQAGQAIDLGWVKLRQDAVVEVRVIGVWAKGRREPWWLATNRGDSLGQLVSLYDRRMTIEEQIRDTKGARFGFALVWSQITTPEALSRFVLLLGLAVLVLTAIGHAVAQKCPNVRLPSRTKGPRLSLLTVGLLFWPLWQDKILITPRFLKNHIPPPSLRTFKWIDRYEAKKC
jgi:hypothetical protein